MILTLSQPIARVARRLRDVVDAAFAGRPAEPTPGDRAEGLLAWGQRLLPQHFAKPPSAMHRWLADRLDEVPASGGAKINLLGPRGAAKSTIGTLACVLRSPLEGAVVEAYGPGQRIRGRRRRWRRPTLIVCDDIENEVQAASTRQRATSSDWFHGTLLKAGTRRTNLVNLATALHRDALAMRLHRTAGWRSRVFRSVVSWPTNTSLWDRWETIYCDRDRQNTQADARRFYEANRFEMDAGAEVLWPEEEDLYTLMKMRVESGRPAFEREKQNSPIDPERCEWPEEYFDEAIWFDEWPERLAMKTIALDPSKGRDAQHGDYSAIVLMGVDDDGRLYIEADLERRPTPRMVADAVRWCRKHKPDAFGVEANQWQQQQAGEFEAQFARQGQLSVSPSELHSYTQKEMRIRRLGPYLSQRRLRFRRGSPGTELLVEQLRDFPIGSHDDGPDALEMALRLGEELWRRG